MEKKLNWKQIGQFVATLVKLFTVISATLKKVKVGPEIIDWLLGSGKMFLEEKLEEIGAEFLRQTTPVIVAGAESITLSYRLMINYTLSLADMIKAGKYDGTVSSNINSHNFPTRITGKQKVAIELWHPNKYFNNGDEVIAELEKVMPGYRFATLPELLALGAAQPELQWSFPIAAFGSIWHQADGNRRFAFLYGYDTRRHLHLFQLASDFHAHWRFAVVRKPA